MSDGGVCSVFGNAKCHPELRPHEEHKKSPAKEEKPCKTRSPFGNAEASGVKSDKHKTETHKHEKQSKTCSPFGNAACRAQKEKKGK